MLDRRMRLLLAAALAALALTACQPAGEQPPEGRVPAANEPAAEQTPSEPADDAPIVVENPRADEELTSPAILSGSSNVFEATVSYRIVTSEGEVVARGFTTATCGSGCRGTFSVTVPFEVEQATEATIELFEESAENGKPLHKVEIPVTLLPS